MGSRFVASENIFREFIETRKRSIMRTSNTAITVWQFNGRSYAAQPFVRAGVEGIMGSTRGSTLRNWRTVLLAVILAAASAIAAVLLTRPTGI